MLTIFWSKSFKSSWSTYGGFSSRYLVLKSRFSSIWFDSVKRELIKSLNYITRKLCMFCTHHEGTAGRKIKGRGGSSRPSALEPVSADPSCISPPFENFKWERIARVKNDIQIGLIGQWTAHFNIFDLSVSIGLWMTIH